MEVKVTPKQQGLVVGVAAVAVTKLIAIFLPPLDLGESLPFLGCVLYSCAVIGTISTWSYKLAAKIPSEEGIPKHVQAVFISVLFMAGFFPLTSIHPFWVEVSAKLLYMWSAMYLIYRWNNHGPSAA